LGTISVSRRALLHGLVFWLLVGWFVDCLLVGSLVVGWVVGWFAGCLLVGLLVVCWLFGLLVLVALLVVGFGWYVCLFVGWLFRRRVLY
jgi:hypothetical protein